MYLISRKKEIIKNIYNAICDSAQIAIGMKSEKQTSINLQYIKLHTKQDISSAILNSALKYLEDAGYISLNSAFKSLNKIKIFFTETRLKNFIKGTSNELMRDVLLYFIRNYGKEIFSKFDTKKVGKIKPYVLDAEVKFEYSNETFHTAQLFVNDFKIENNNYIKIF